MGIILVGCQLEGSLIFDAVDILSSALPAFTCHENSLHSVCPFSLY